MTAITAAGARERFIPDVTVDVEALRERYRLERDKRVSGRRAAKVFAPVRGEGKLANFGKDPNASGDRGFGPVERDVEVLCIGGGFMGLMLGSNLVKAGIDDFVIVDVAADFGGTWYWNRYPGIRCDTESYIYLPLLEETGYMPREKYSTGPEIFAYCQQLARRFGLYEHAIFQTGVTGMSWDDEAERWLVTTDRGDKFRARFVTTQSGLFTRPRLPTVPGLQDFGGHSFHTSRWDYAYTGSSLENLRDKRVAVVGTGATGLQVIPKLAEAAGELVVFQRTPDQVAPRANGPTDAQWFKSLPKGWQRDRITGFDLFVTDRVGVECSTDDAWVDFARYQMDAVAALGSDATAEQIMDTLERSDLEWNEALRERVSEIVEDPETAEKLKAWYRTPCKRLGFSDDYLPAFNRPNVTLLSTADAPIERITASGIVSGGTEYPVDCIVFATGFDVEGSWTDKAGYDVVGRGGELLSQKFAQGVRTHFGLLSNGFPNLFLLGFDQAGASSNIPRALLAHADHVAALVKSASEKGIRTFEATREAEDGWCARMEELFEMNRPFLSACTPGTYNSEGNLDNSGNTLTHIYAPGHEYFRMLEDWRASGEHEGVTVTLKE